MSEVKEVSMRIEVVTENVPAHARGLYLCGYHRDTGEKARVFVDFFGETPIEDVTDEQLAQVVLRKLKAARHALVSGLAP